MNAFFTTLQTAAHAEKPYHDKYILTAVEFIRNIVRFSQNY